MAYKFNKYQTPLSQENLDKMDNYVKNELIDAISSIYFIQKLIDPNRPYAKDLERDKKGRIKVDLENPHILENMNYFREAALYFEEHNTYTHLHPSKHPNSEYQKFWKEEKRRCEEGYLRNSDGEWITGYNYYYWNYSPIMVAISIEDETVDENVKEIIEAFEAEAADRVEGFPFVWDMDYFYYHYINQCESKGKYGTVLKTRGRGYSFKGGSMLGRNLNNYPKSKSWALASEKGDLIEDGLLSKAWDNLNFINSNTPWRKRRQEKDTIMHKKASYKDLDTGEYKGYMSEIIGVTTKNDPEKARGKRGKIILMEEAGRYLDLLTVWGIARPSMEQGKLVFGLMISFGTGGCLTRGNRVWTSEGDLVNIEDLTKEQGIIGYNAEEGKYSIEEITYWQPYTEKQCVKLLTNTGREIECSKDHPIYSLINRKRNNNEFDFIEASSLKIGSNIAIIDTFDLFGKRIMKNPWLIGHLIGDGSYGYDQSVKISLYEESIIEYLEDNFNISKVKKRNNKSDGKPFYDIGIKGIRQDLRDLGIINQVKLEKTFPKDIHSYDKKSLQEFISGYYDADGYVALRYNKKRNTPIAEITITSICKHMLEDTRLLLQKFGIHGKLRERKPRKNKKGIQDVNSWYEFTIADKRSLLRFVDNFKLKTRHKQDRLNLIKEKYSKVKQLSRDNDIRLEKIVSIENTGIKQVYNLTANNTNTYLANGVITHNTEGAAFEGLETLFYKGGGYRVHMTRNIFDKTKGNGTCAFYCGEYMNREGCYDKDGNSDVIKALIEIFYARLEVIKNDSDPKAIVQEKADRSITPQEAVMRTEGNIFPISDLKDYLSEIKPVQEQFVSSHYVGKLSFKEQGVEWFPNADVRVIREYPTSQRGDKHGAVEIFVQPKAIKGIIPKYRYIAGIDPFDDDIGTSLGSIFIFDRFTDNIVAEYTGRPTFANDFYEICAKLIIYYNALALYENKNKGLFGYFSNNNMVHLLADNPKYLSDIDLATNKESYGNKKKGFNPTKEVNAHGRRLQADWMKEILDIDTVEGDEVVTQKIKRLRRIRSIAYIEECIKWNPDGNFDRVSAMNGVMILREELRKYDISPESYNPNKSLSNDPHFARVLGLKPEYKNKFNWEK